MINLPNKRVLRYVNVELNPYKIFFIIECRFYMNRTYEKIKQVLHVSQTILMAIRIRGVGTRFANERGCRIAGKT